MTQRQPSASLPLALDVEAFPEAHPAINGHMLLEQARTALARYGGSPALFEVLWAGQTLPAQVSFRPPDPRSADTLQRPAFVEHGAVVMAGLVMRATEGLQITRVTRRGSRVDYFVGREPGEQLGILEVGGTDEESLTALRTAKRAQLLESYYRRPPFQMAGYVSTTRFARPQASALDEVPAEDKGAS